MARIQRTHHPIFQGSLETSTFRPTPGADAPEAVPAAATLAPEACPLTEGTVEVGCLQDFHTW